MAKGKKTGGRVAGTPNQFTTKVKNAVEKAFDEVGGVDYLVKVAEEDPKTFCTLLGKCLPKDINATIDLRPLVKRIDLSGNDGK